MFSPRRMRLLMLAAVGTFVFLLFYSGFHSDGASDVAQDFYSKTEQALRPGQAVMDSETGRKAGHIPADKDADGDVDEDDKVAGAEMQERLKAAEQEAKNNANEKGGMRPDPPSKVIGAGNSAEGQNKDKKQDKVVQKAGSEDVAKPKAEENSQQVAAESSLKAILEKAPVVIFSKSYCPFSKRAKGLLLEKYLITPDPYVVELDEHPIGSAIQDALLDKTGRRTVPNILINGVSIGGADDIIAMDKDDKLIGKIRDLGKTRVEIVERFVSKGSGH